MPWVANIRVLDGRTIQPKQYESAKAEREMIISFGPGELKTDDDEMIRGYFRHAGNLVKAEVDEELSKAMSMGMPTGSSARTTPSTPAASPPTGPPKKEDKPASKSAASPPTSPVKPPVKPDKTLPAQAEAPETVEGEPAYDRSRLHWNYCDEIVEHDGKKVLCGNRDLDAEYEKAGRDGKMQTKRYQACFQCRVFLNADGKKVQMEPREESA